MVVGGLIEMNEFLNSRLHLGGLRSLATWLLLVTPVAALAGSASALFLWSLDVVTSHRHQHPWMVGLLPLAGPVIWGMYRLAGRDAERGTNLILDEIHQSGGGVPLRMAPLVLVTTLLTHAFGGSAGREGTAVQMGGALAGGFADGCRVPARHRRMLLMAGVAAGFGSVFGTPLAGAVFAMEVLAVGLVRCEFLVPCLMAAVVGDLTCTAWGIEHLDYHGRVSAPLTVGTGMVATGMFLGKVAVAGVLFGLVSLLFTDLVHAIQAAFRRWIRPGWLRPMVGGLLVIALSALLGTHAYLGLGVNSPMPGEVTMIRSFEPGGAGMWSWLWKTLTTALTLGSGFKGGEVTPLFFVGAAAGNAVGVLLDAPVGLFAALGFVAVFAGASNTPLACTLMGIELFGADHGVAIALACFMAYFFSGHSGIYGSQRVAIPKVLEHDRPIDVTLDEWRRRRPADSDQGETART